MKPKTIYLVLCLLGAILPYWQFVPWLAENGPNMPLFFQQLFVNRIGAFFRHGCIRLRCGATGLRP